MFNSSCACPCAPMMPKGLCCETHVEPIAGIACGRKCSDRTTRWDTCVGPLRRSTLLATASFFTSPVQLCIYIWKMEYDMAAGTGPPESKAYPHESVASGGNDGNLRIKAPKVDVSALAEPITLPFSGRTARNRFLKAPSKTDHHQPSRRYRILILSASGSDGASLPLESGGRGYQGPRLPVRGVHASLRAMGRGRDRYHCCWQSDASI